MYILNTMNSDSLRSLLIRFHIVLLYQKSTIFRRRRWIIVYLNFSARFSFFLSSVHLSILSFVHFRRRTVILTVAMISILIVTSVVLGLLYGLADRK